MKSLKAWFCAYYSVDCRSPLILAPISFLWSSLTLPPERHQEQNNPTSKRIPKLRMRFIRTTSLVLVPRLRAKGFFPSSTHPPFFVISHLCHECFSYLERVAEQAKRDPFWKLKRQVVCLGTSNKKSVYTYISKCLWIVWVKFTEHIFRINTYIRISAYMDNTWRYSFISKPI